MAVHPRPVVLEQGLGHECGRVPGVARDVLHDVLVEHQLVGHTQQRVVTHVDLSLTARRHLVVLHLDLDPEVLHHKDHLGPQVLEMVHGRHREVPLLVARLEAEVRLLVASRVPNALYRVDLVEGGPLVLREPYVVEDEELRLWPEVDRVGDPGGLEIPLSFECDIAGITRVVLESDRIVHEAVEVEGLVLAEGIEHRSRGVREQDHVRFLDLLKAADGRSVETESLHEGGLGQLMSRHGKMLHETGQVAKADVDDLDAFVLHQLNDFGSGAILHGSSLVRH